MHAEAYLRDIQPTELGKIPQHPLDRCMDICFLNTAEQFTPVLDSNAANDLLIVAASPYLCVDGDRRLLEAFEAAHSIMLAIFAAPHHLELTAAQLEPYAQVLFEVRHVPIVQPSNWLNKPVLPTNIVASPISPGGQAANPVYIIPLTVAGAATAFSVYSNGAFILPFPCRVVATDP